MRGLLYWLSGRLPCRIISDNGLPYLERYYVGTLFGARFYLHRFVGSDPARGLHDHPWPWARSLVLAGWYYEETRAGTRKVRWFNKLTGDTFHRVILPKSSVLVGWTGEPVNQGWMESPIYKRIGPLQTCWTLFWHKAEYVKPWGFLRPIEGETATMWVPHNYPKDGKGTPGAWWETVPRGKNEPRRMPA